ncbi:YMGG-like glycine zipper-containing protein, partial [Microvirga massiliensis]|uniref:YMGG-like glycine zipper-containing protein n=1 Tax=Microvirga massiliensis TaxID=1033741 RepID=UPI00062B48C8
MSRFIGIVFHDEGAASEASGVLKELQAEGSLKLAGTAVVNKDPEGTLVAKRVVEGGPLGTLVGALIGGLAGLMGGPTGAAIGAAGGALVGRAADQINLGERVTFAERISRAMRPGSTAVLAEVTEYSETSLDTRMKALGGVVVRE